MCNLNRVILLLSLTTIYGCSSLQKQKDTHPCNKEYAVQATDRRFKRKGFKMKYYESVVSQDSLYFYIIYQVKEGYGGGAEFKVSKKDCNIVDQKFYQ